MQNLNFSGLEYILLLILIVSFLGTLILIPIVKAIGVKFDFNDIPNRRKLHKKSIVNLGGVPIFIGFLIGLFSVYFTGALDSYSLENISSYGKILILISSSVFFLGLIDDLFKLSAKFRLVFQFIVASIAWFNDLKINSLDLSFVYPSGSDIQLSVLISYLITVIWIVGVINAFNWIDGLDGLASGLLIIASLSFFIIEYTNGVQYLTCILTSLIGSVIAFLFYNYHPAKILMGDSGSYFLGFNLAVISFISSTDINKSLNVVVVLLIMMIPILDMTYVIFNRIKKGKSPFYPDKTHIHHRLLARRLNQKETVRIIWGFSILLSILALVIDEIISPIFIIYSMIIYSFFDVRVKRYMMKLFFRK